MQRGETGRYEVTSVGGEQVRAFVPAPLPPFPPLVLEGTLQQAFESAVLAFGRLFRSPQSGGRGQPWGLCALSENVLSEFSRLPGPPPWPPENTINTRSRIAKFGVP